MALSHNSNVVIIGDLRYNNDMRDVKVIQVGDAQLLDIDIIDGAPEWLFTKEQSKGQRSAIASYIAKGSIPGMRDIGVEWESFLQIGSSESYITIDNQMKQMVLAYGTAQDESDNTQVYTPIALPTDSGLSVGVIRS